MPYKHGVNIITKNVTLKQAKKYGYKTKKELAQAIYFSRERKLKNKK
jgi:hypothetical protein